MAAQMTGNEAVIVILKRLAAEGIDYMVTGSYASNVHGIPRSTKDADFILEAPPKDIEALLAGLKPPLEPDNQLFFETVTGSSRWIVRLERSEFVIELFLLNSHPFDRSRFDRKIRLVILPGVEGWVPTPEDVIVQKLRWVARNHREKDWIDACDVIRVQGSALDWDYIVKWCAELGAAQVLDDARRKTGC